MRSLSKTNLTIFWKRKLTCLYQIWVILTPLGLLTAARVDSRWQTDWSLPCYPTSYGFRRRHGEGGRPQIKGWSAGSASACIGCDLRWGEPNGGGPDWRGYV